MEKIIRRRAKFILIFFGFLFPIILLRLFFIQVIEHAEYREKALDNLYNLSDVTPKRGSIYDRRGLLLARTSPVYNIQIQLAGVLPNIDKRRKNIAFVKPKYDENSIRNLYKLLNSNKDGLTRIYSINEIKAKIKIRYDEEVRKIKKKLKKYIAGNNIKSKRKIRKKHRALEHDFFNRRYDFIKNVPASIAYAVYEEGKIFNPHLFCKYDFDESFVTKLKLAKDLTSRYLRHFFSDAFILKLREYEIGEKLGRRFKRFLIKELNRLLQTQFYNHDIFKRIKLSRLTQILLSQEIPNNSIKKLNYLIDMNRMVLEDAYPKTIKHRKLLGKRIEKIQCIDKYPGFVIKEIQDRKYYNPTVAPHLLGHVGPVTPREIKYFKDSYKYKPSDSIGKFGIEKLLEEKLRGERIPSVKTRSKKIYMDKFTNGEDVYLTIDSRLQGIANKELDKMIENKNAAGGAAVVIDIKTGEILVFATSPRYDNNLYNKKYDELKEAKNFPLLNRAIGYKFHNPPGSVFKIPIALYALESGAITQYTRYLCRGYMHNPGSFKCSHSAGCGNINVVRAIEGSCNVFFYNVGEKLGSKALERCSKIFGFGMRSTLGLIHEAAGYFPTPEKKRRRGEAWVPGDSRMIGIGQRFDATPLQVARCMAMVALGGVMPKLKIYRDAPVSTNYIENSNGAKTLVSASADGVETNADVLWQWPINKKYLELVKEGMKRVLVGHHGTATNVAKMLGDIKIAAKTGTAQIKVKVKGKYKYKLKDHAWFAGYFPLKNPRYSFAVLVQEGGVGAKTAGPVAAEIIKALKRYSYIK